MQPGTRRIDRFRRTGDAELDRARRFRLRLEKSAAARKAALASICPDGSWWLVRIGGAQRGRLLRVPTRKQAEAAVKEHYDKALLDFIKQQIGRKA